MHGKSSSYWRTLHKLRNRALRAERRNQETLSSVRQRLYLINRRHQVTKLNVRSRLRNLQKQSLISSQRILYPENSLRSISMVSPFTVKSPLASRRQRSSAILIPGSKSRFVRRNKAVALKTKSHRYFRQRAQTEIKTSLSMGINREILNYLLKIIHK